MFLDSDGNLDLQGSRGRSIRSCESLGVREVRVRVRSS